MSDGVVYRTVWSSITPDGVIPCPKGLSRVEAERWEDDERAAGHTPTRAHVVVAPEDVRGPVIVIGYNDIEEPRIIGEYDV